MRIVTRVNEYCSIALRTNCLLYLVQYDRVAWQHHSIEMLNQWDRFKDKFTHILSQSQWEFIHIDKQRCWRCQWCCWLLSASFNAIYDYWIWRFPLTKTTHKLDNRSIQLTKLQARWLRRITHTLTQTHRKFLALAKNIIKKTDWFLALNRFQ